MKIAFDAQTLFEEKKTGIGWTIEKIIDNLEVTEENKFQLNYFSIRKNCDKKRQLERYINKGFDIKVCKWFPISLYKRIWDFFPISYSVLMRDRADINQFFNYAVPPGVRGKKVVYIYDMVYKAYPSTMEASNRLYMEKHIEKSIYRADAIITISEFSKNEIIKYLNIPSEKIFVVPCGVDSIVYHPDINYKAVESVKEKYGIRSDYYLYLGTLEPRKNIPFIIEAYHILKNREKNNIPRLVIAGKKGWEYGNIFETVKKYQLENDVIFTGYVDEQDKPALLKGAICFLFPSLYEGFGIPLLEAMACGTPAVVSNNASLPEVVGDAGIILKDNSIHKMADIMARLSQDAAWRGELAKKGVLRAQEFSWINSSRKLLEVYRNILNK